MYLCRVIHIFFITYSVPGKWWRRFLISQSCDWADLETCCNGENVRKDGSRNLIWQNRRYNLVGNTKHFHVPPTCPWYTGLQPWVCMNYSSIYFSGIVYLTPHHARPDLPALWSFVYSPPVWGPDCLPGLHHSGLRQVTEILGSGQNISGKL